MIEPRRTYAPVAALLAWFARACGVHDARLRYHRRRRPCPCPAFVRTPNNRPNLALYRGGGGESFRANKRKLHESQILSANMNELAKAMKDILDSMDFGMLTNLISIQLILLKFCSECTKTRRNLMLVQFCCACVHLSENRDRGATEPKPRKRAGAEARTRE